MPFGRRLGKRTTFLLDLLELYDQLLTRRSAFQVGVSATV